MTQTSALTRTYARCMGTNHKHADALIVQCPECSADTVLYRGRRLDARAMGYKDARRFACWHKDHECKIVPVIDWEEKADLDAELKSLESILTELGAKGMITMETPEFVRYMKVCDRLKEIQRIETLGY